MGNGAEAREYVPLGWEVVIQDPEASQIVERLDKFRPVHFPGTQDVGKIHVSSVTAMKKGREDSGLLQRDLACHRRAIAS